MIDDFAGVTVNERLFATKSIAEYDAAVASGDLKNINEVLAKVDLRRNVEGIH